MTKAEPQLLAIRSSGGRVSGSDVAASARPRTPSPASTQKIARQLPNSVTRLPNSGASIGDTLKTSMTSDISRAASGPVCRSRTTARGMVMPAQAPTPCRNRMAISISIFGASAQPMPPMV